MKKKLILIGGILILVSLFFVFDFQDYLSLAGLKAQLDAIRGFYHAHPVFTLALFMAGYVLMAAFSLPGAAVATLGAGAVFGLFTGVVAVSFASSIGATLAFWMSRFLFKDGVQNRFAPKIKTINQGIETEGGFYLFTLRLVPVFPFFIINLVMGVTPISTRTFYLVSQIGMLPATFVYVNAGTALGHVSALGDILSPQILLSFALLGIFPLAARRIVDRVRAKKVYERWEKPEKFDYNLVVIGAGAAGLVSAYIASAVRAKVALIEDHKMGGDCLNTGCVPSKSLIASSRMLARAADAQVLGLENTKIGFTFSQVMARVKANIRRIEPHDSIERYTQLGVDCIQGRGTLISPWQVEVKTRVPEPGQNQVENQAKGRVLTTRNIIVATGAKPWVPDIKGLDKVNYLTSDTIWEITELPKRLLVLGAGPIGCELAQAFLRLGSAVTLVQRGKRILKKEDPDAAQLVLDRFKTEGMDLRLGHAAKEIRIRDGEKYLVCVYQGQAVEIGFDSILIALGRVANTQNLGLEKLGISLDGKNQITANAFLETRYPNIFCCGDVHGRYQFTHTASHEAWYASVNALFGKFKKFRANYSAIPWATYTDPEVARVGLNEQEAADQNLAYEKVVYSLDGLDRAIADSTNQGFVKVLTRPGKDAILGVTITGHHASEMISEFVLAMTHGIGLNKILGTIHIYPTMAEANKAAAGLWKKAHAPEKLLGWVEKFHTWMRN